MKLTLTVGTKHGMEVWSVLIDGRVVAVFMSEAAARTKFRQLSK